LVRFDGEDSCTDGGEQEGRRVDNPGAYQATKTGMRQFLRD
jgi:hypothetical protein